MMMKLSALVFSALLAATHAQEVPLPRYDYTLYGSNKCAMVNIAMDESGSMATEHAFMRNTALPDIIEYLKPKVKHVFVCSHGFGNDPELEGVDDYGYRYLGCIDAGSTNPFPDFAGVTNWRTENSGRHEDGYHVSEKAMRDVPDMIDGWSIMEECGILYKNLILVTDEDRDPVNKDVSKEDVIATASELGYIINLVVNVYIGDPNLRNIGMRYNYNWQEQPQVPGNFPNEIFAQDGSGGYIRTENAMAPYFMFLSNGQGFSDMDYGPLIEDTRGAIWSIQTLRAGGTWAEGFAKAFVEIKGEEIICDDPKKCCVGPRCGEAGEDPHITTWYGDHFEFHGQCDLVMASDPEFMDGLGLDIHIRTKIVRYWSYIKQAVIRIGSDILEIEGSGDALDNENHYWINYEYQGDLETFAGFPVKMYAPSPYKRHYDIDISSKFPGQSIEVMAFKEFVRVKFVGGAQGAFENTVGILGSTETGELVGRDGVTVFSDFYEFGDEWQVLPAEPKLFKEMEHPQFPEKCLEPEDPRGERRRRLDESTVSMEEAEKACAVLKDKDTIKDCVYDILATQDLDMVGAF